MPARSGGAPAAPGIEYEKVVGGARQPDPVPAQRLARGAARRHRSGEAAGAEARRRHRAHALASDPGLGRASRAQRPRRLRRSSPARDPRRSPRRSPRPRSPAAIAGAGGSPRAPRRATPRRAPRPASGTARTSGSTCSISCASVSGSAVTARRSTAIRPSISSEVATWSAVSTARRPAAVVVEAVEARPTRAERRRDS